MPYRGPPRVPGPSGGTRRIWPPSAGYVAQQSASVGQIRRVAANTRTGALPAPPWLLPQVPQPRPKCAGCRSQRCKRHATQEHNPFSRRRVSRPRRRQSAFRGRTRLSRSHSSIRQQYQHCCHQGQSNLSVRVSRFGLTHSVRLSLRRPRSSLETVQKMAIRAGIAVFAAHAAAPTECRL